MRNVGADCPHGGAAAFGDKLMKEWQAARRLVRETASRWSQRSNQDDEASLRDRYLADLALDIQRRGWRIDAAPQTCALCGKRRGGLRTGFLPHVGPLLYCRRCADAYHILRGEIDPAREESKVHLAGAYGVPRCGIGVLTTTDPSAVTCLRCQLYLKKTNSQSLLDRLFRFL